MPKTLLLRRLERLEAPSEINDDLVVVQIVYVDGDGSETRDGVFHLRKTGRRWKMQGKSGSPGGS